MSPQDYSRAMKPGLDIFQPRVSAPGTEMIPYQADNAGTDETTRYDATARFLHWLSALVVLWAMISGLIIASLPADLALRQTIAALNVSLTTSLVPFFTWRIIHRIRNRPPTWKNISRKNQQIAHIAHVSLYVLVAVVQVSGILMMTGPIEMFGLFQLPQVLDYPALNEGFAVLHKAVCRVLAVMVVLHIAAVVHHQRRGHRILARMT